MTRWEMVIEIFFFGITAILVILGLLLVFDMLFTALFG